MATWLKQSTSVDVPVGPFLDETDGKTAETGLTITQADIRLKKNNGNWAQKAAAQTLTHEENGWYEVTLDATDTGTLGILLVAIQEAGALPVWREFMVVAANIYDSVVGGGDVLDVSVIQLLGTAWLTPGTAGTPDVNAKLWNALATVELPLVPTTAGRKLDVSVGGEAGVDWANVGSPTTTLNLSGTTINTTQKVDVETIKTNPVVNGGTITFPTTATLASTTNITAGTIATVTNVTTVNGLAANVITAAAIAADAITAAKVADGTIDAATFAAGAIDAAAIATGAITAAKFAAGAIDAAAIAADAIGSSELAASAVTEIQAGLSTLDAAGVRTAVGLASANLDTQLDALPTNAELATALGTADDAVLAQVALVKAKTDSLTFTVAGKVDANPTAINGDATSAANLAKTTRAIGRGTVGAASTTTSIVTSAFAPAGAAADQFKGRIITFDADTTTTALRGQSTDITASSNAATPVLTVTALTTAPASGDTFSVT